MNAKIVEEKARREALKAKEAALIEKEKEYKAAKAEEEAFAEKQNQRIQWGFSNDKVECLIPEDKLKEYIEAFKKIADETKVEDIDELVKNFIEAEE